MTRKEMLRRARAMNADQLARQIGVDATVMRRWINGGVNANVEAALKELWGV